MKKGGGGCYNSGVLLVWLLLHVALLFIRHDSVMNIRQVSTNTGCCCDIVTVRSSCRHSKCYSNRDLNTRLF